jgi:hypothetical protein
MKDFGRGMHMGNGKSAAADKAARELSIFHEFMEVSGLRIGPASVENRAPPEPDIRAMVDGEGPVAFELTEICNPELAKDIADHDRRGTPHKFHMLDDPSAGTLRSKLGTSIRPFSQSNSSATAAGPLFPTISACSPSAM